MSPRNHGFICLAVLTFAGQAAAMPQDSTVFWKLPPLNLEVYIDNGKTFPIPQAGIPTSAVLELQATVYSNPNGSGTIEVDNFERSANGQTNVLPYKRDRGGNIHLKGSNFYISGGYVPRITEPQNEYLGIGRFSGLAPRGAAGTGGDLRYDGASPRGWLRIKYRPPQTTSTNLLSQPYAVRTHVIPIGSWNINRAATEGIGRTVSFDMQNLPIQPNRVLYHQTLYQDFSGAGQDPANQIFSYKSTGVHGSCGKCGATTISGHDRAINYGLNKSGNTENDYGVDRNRGFTLVQILAAQCSDGAGGFTGINVGARTVQAYVDQAATLTNYGGCHGSSNGTYVIESTGDNIWKDVTSQGTTYDRFRFAHKGYSNNRDFICRVDQLENTNAWARAGIMLRTGTVTGDIGIGIFVTPGNGIISQYRSSLNGSYSSTAVSNVKAPVWLRLQYSNGVTKTYRSSDGVNWGTPIATYSRTFSGTYQAGLAAASRSTAPNTSVYSNLKGF